MMRPTTSSAQKVHEKVQVNSPPRQKVASTDKPKGATKPNASLKTRLEAHRDQGGDNKENDGDHEPSIAPDVAGKDSTETASEAGPTSADPAETGEQVQL